MSQKDGPDLSLPDEILAVIPTDPYEQLDLARKITSMAIASRVSNLESQVSGLRQMLLEKDRLVHQLQGRVSSLESLYHDADSSFKDALDENMKLTQERDSLAITAKKLGRDFAKLEAFKRQLMQSLNDEHRSQSETSNVRMVPGDQVEDHSNGLSPAVAHGSYSNKEGLGEARERVSLTPHLSPAFTPPRSYSAASSPKQFSGAASPTSSHYDIRPWSSSSQQSSVPSSPPRSHSSASARHPRIDGKEFFRQARSRLSYQEFSAFLANIKELNARKQSREETLRKAEEIFGTDKNDLYNFLQHSASSRTNDRDNDGMNKKKGGSKRKGK